MILRLRQNTWEFPGPVLIMGILNVTPDSFSDGGRYFEHQSAIEHALRLVAKSSKLRRPS